MPIFSVATAGSVGTVVPVTVQPTIITGTELAVYFDVNNPLCYNASSPTTTLNDLSGYNQTGTLNFWTGSTRPVVTDGVVVISSTDTNIQYISTGYAPTIIAPSTHYTFEIWFWDDSFGIIPSNATTALVGNYSGTPNSFAIMHMSSTGAILYGEKILSAGAMQASTSGLVTINTSTWYHFVKTADNTNQNIYVNGTRVAQFGRPSGDVSSSTIRFGGGFGARGQTCKLGPMRVYMGKALTAEEVLNNFNAERARFGV